MSEPITIALDVMGGDHGPEVVIPAAARAAREDKGIHFRFYGVQEKMEPYLASFRNMSDRYTVIHTDVVIDNHIKPSQALRSGKQSSMRLAIEAVQGGQADCVVSAGNTGALMATAKLVLKCLPGIQRPAIASIFPTLKGSSIVLDLGANIHCNAEHLVQFSVLGAVYARVSMGIDKPTVGLLNIGSEDMKGHESLRSAGSILSAVPFPGRYQGFVEGNDIAYGTTDVVVTDGFTGNIALKTAEGVGKLIGQLLREEFKSSPFAAFGYIFCSKALGRVKKRIDPRQYNGGLFLGLNGVCVKSHGSADVLSFSKAIHVAADMVKNRFNDRVRSEIEELAGQETFVSMAEA